MSMADLARTGATRCPDKDAVVDPRLRYSFRQLEDLSLGFAGFLWEHRLEKGDRVVICAPKTASLIVAILGILKAGAIYVPLDPKTPKSRLNLIVQDIEPQFVITTRAIFDSIDEELKSTCTFIDEEHLLNKYFSAPPPAILPAILPQDGAYCIYTSGSTGKPKGVVIEHGSIDAFFLAFTAIMQIDEQSICMNTSELCFDVHVMDLLFPLYKGATVHLSCGPLVVRRLLETVEKERVTHFTAVAPTMTLMTQSRRFHEYDLSSLSRVMTGAEIVNVKSTQIWLERVPDLTIINGYGPTEVTVICTAYPISTPEPHRTDYFPIGKPLKECHVLLMRDGNIIEMPNVDAELFVGGPQVMRGYWNDAKQTDERIVSINGIRYYRTGDLCRWRDDGNLDFVGRNDDEIKISGYRVNLNEIKRVMERADGVKDGHPMVVLHPSLGKVIAACFVAEIPETQRDQSRDFFGIHSTFRKNLPYYMVPSLYFAFDRFPTLPSGKVDKKKVLQHVMREVASAGQSVTHFHLRTSLHGVG